MIGVVATWCLLAGLALWLEKPHRAGRKKAEVLPLSQALHEHLGTSDVREVVTMERVFPIRLRVDVQKAIEQVLSNETEVVAVHGVEAMGGAFFWALRLGDILAQDANNASVQTTPPQYELVSVGEDKPIPVLRNGLWLLKRGPHAMVLLMTPSYYQRPAAGLLVQLACRDIADARQSMEELSEAIVRAFRKSGTYRGKVLSLENDVESSSGEVEYLRVHRVPRVSREEVILPEATLAAIERNVLGFVKHRKALKDRGLHVKKGLLFYGPPGAGKTHTLRYLINALHGHTIFLMRAEQMASLAEYMMLARLLQPSVVIIGDVDLIALQRSEEGHNLPLLNRLLEEMDGLEEEAEMLFILTTNRPLSLEEALAGRPGRIDQAIEFPLPDVECRRRLIRLYAKGIQLSEELCENVAQRTEGVSAAFIKELMRRAWQYHLEGGAGGELTWQQVRDALDEMTVHGGKLNLKLLGADRFGFQA